ncbi:MAG: hypothetical protein F4W93_04895 [Dehalococcoidia bacterium]|nr:hypothetical protein [Dehalococcoidia bacterium]
MVMETDMEEDGTTEGVDESEATVDEFDLAELRREFAGQTETSQEDRESDSDGDDGDSEGAEEEESEEPSSEGEPFASDRERYQAVVRAAREHGLGIDDLEELERAESAEEVERRARGMAERRTLDRRVEALERQLAPVQQFDSNRPSAPSSGSDEAWIDRYMAGDRSARAVAAARRAFD